MKKLLFVLGILVLLLPLAYAKTATNITATPGVKSMLITCPWENLHQENGMISCTEGGTITEKGGIPTGLILVGVVIIGALYYLKQKGKI